MLKELRENMDKGLKETRTVNYKKELNWNSGAEKYDECNEKFIKGIKERMWAVEQRIGKLEDRRIEMTESEE